MHLKFCESKALLALERASPRASPCWVTAQALPSLITENDQFFNDVIININKRTSIYFHLCLESRLNPLKLNTTIGTETQIFVAVSSMATFWDADKEALMRNICTHNKMQTKLFASTNLHLEKRRRQLLNRRLMSSSHYFSILPGKNVLTHWSKIFKTAIYITKILLKKCSRFFPGRGWGGRGRRFFTVLEEKLENTRFTEGKIILYEPWNKNM